MHTVCVFTYTAHTLTTLDVTHSGRGYPGAKDHRGYLCASSCGPCYSSNLCCPLPFLLRCLAASCKRDSDTRTLPSLGSTWQHAMHRGINVDILQVFQGLGVEEAKSGARGEGNPNANASHSHVGDDHPFILVGLQLILGESRKWVTQGMRGTARTYNGAVSKDAKQGGLAESLLRVMGSSCSPAP